MIKKLDKHLANDLNSTNMSANRRVVIDVVKKINEIIDLLNTIVIDVDGTKCVDGSKKPTDPYAEQRKWVGKLCWFWDIHEEYKFVDILGEVADNGTYFQKDGIVSYLNCEPVKPDDNIIYKGENNE